MCRCTSLYQNEQSLPIQYTKQIYLHQNMDRGGVTPDSSSVGGQVFSSPPCFGGSSTPSGSSFGSSPALSLGSSFGMPLRPAFNFSSLFLFLATIFASPSRAESRAPSSLFAYRASSLIIMGPRSSARLDLLPLPPGGSPCPNYHCPASPAFLRHAGFHCPSRVAFAPVALHYLKDGCYRWKPPKLSVSDRAGLDTSSGAHQRTTAINKYSMYQGRISGQN